MLTHALHASAVFSLDEFPNQERPPPLVEPRYGRVVRAGVAGQRSPGIPSGRLWPPARAARLRLRMGLRRAAKTTKRRSGILPSRCSGQRLALDADLCGGLIRGKGARLRIQHRLAPLPLAAPRDAAFAAPPASPSPESGIEGLPAAERAASCG